MVTPEQIESLGLKALNIAREAFDDAGYRVSAPGEGEPGEFYVDAGPTSFLVKIEML